MLVPLIDPSLSRFGSKSKSNHFLCHESRRIKDYIKAGYKVALDIELSKFYNRVSHDIIIARLAKYVDDAHLLRLIGRYLRAGITDGLVIHKRIQGIPKGGPLYSLLTNVVLEDLRQHLKTSGFNYVSYDSGFFIYVKNAWSGRRVKEQVRQFIERRF